MYLTIQINLVQPPQVVWLFWKVLITSWCPWADFIFWCIKSKMNVTLWSVEIIEQLPPCQSRWLLGRLPSRATSPSLIVAFQLLFLHYVKHPPPPCAPPWSCGLASDGTCLDAISLPLLQSDSFPLLQSDSLPWLQCDSLPLLQSDSLVGFSHLLPDPASHHLCLGSPHILAEKAVGWSLWYFHLKQAGNNGSSIKTLERNVLRFNATPVHCTVQWTRGLSIGSLHSALHKWK